MKKSNRIKKKSTRDDITNVETLINSLAITEGSSHNYAESESLSSRNLRSRAEKGFTQPVEETFSKQQERRDEIKAAHSSTSRRVTQAEVIENHNKQIIFLSDDKNSPKSDWKYSTFSTDIENNQEVPHFPSNPKWSDTYQATFEKLQIEIRNLIFASEDLIDYGLVNTELNSNCILKGESTLWIILHGDSKKLKAEDSAIIQISKKENSQRVYFLLGVYLNESEYKTFTKQQLVNFNSNSKGNEEYVQEDKSKINIYILDSGDDKINFKIFVNNSMIENNISANFFLPVYGRKKVFIAGSGEGCSVKSFQVTCIGKPKYLKEFDIPMESSKGPTCKGSCDTCRII